MIFLAAGDHVLTLLFNLMGYKIILFSSVGNFLWVEGKDWIPDAMISKYSIFLLFYSHIIMV